MVACKILMAINVAVPLIAVGPVLIALISSMINLYARYTKSTRPMGPSIVVDDEIALRHW